MSDRCGMSRWRWAKLFMALIVCGCAAGTWVTPGVPPEKALVMAAGTITPDDRVEATAQLDIVTPQGHYPLRAALILQKPSYLRIELLPVIGTPDFFLAATPSVMNIFIPSRGEFYSGKPTADNMARFLPWSLSIDDIVAILSGAYPPLAGNRLTYESCAEDRLLCVKMKSTPGDSQTVWLTRDGRMTRLIRYDIDGKETYQATYEDDEPTGRLPGQITIRMVDSGTSVTVRYSGVQIGKANDFSVFELPAPAGVKIKKLD